MLGRILLVLGHDDADEPTTTLIVDPSLLGALIIAAGGLWAVSRLTCRLIHGRIVGRRRRRGACVACGYQLVAEQVSSNT